MTDLTLSVSRTINAPIDKVFDAWLDPALLAKFILPMRDMPQPQVSNDAKQGGKFEIIMQVGENKIPHTGEYLEVNRPNRLVFSWVSPFSVDGSEVSIDFSALENNVTRIQLRHIRFIDEEARANHEGGWSTILEILSEVITESVAA